MRRLRSGPVLVLALGGISGCSTAQPDCGCVVESGSERRALSCGENACIAGALVLCDENAQIVARGACSVAGGAATAQAGNAPTEPPATARPHACDDLLVYCNGRCTSPPNTSSNCQATASAGDEDACRSWPLTSGILCHP